MTCTQQGEKRQPKLKQLWRLLLCGLQHCWQWQPTVHRCKQPAKYPCIAMAAAQEATAAASLGTATAASLEAAATPGTHIFLPERRPQLSVHLRHFLQAAAGQGGTARDQAHAR